LVRPDVDQVMDENGMFRNRGGGSLYGASDEEMAAAGRVGGGAPRPEMVGVDIVYLKNVILKFIEAAVREDAAQRDALLPAIATLVQATPQVRASAAGSARNRCRSLVSYGFVSIYVTHFAFISYHSVV
jgi:hypothetical protein